MSCGSQDETDYVTLVSIRGRHQKLVASVPLVHRSKIGCPQVREVLLLQVQDRESENAPVPDVGTRKSRSRKTGKNERR